MYQSTEIFIGTNCFGSCLIFWMDQLKAVKLVKGEWNPFPEYQRCYAPNKINKEIGKWRCCKIDLSTEKKHFLGH